MVEQAQPENLEGQVERQRGPQVVQTAQEARLQVEVHFEGVFGSNRQLPQEPVLLTGAAIPAQNREILGDSEA